MKKMLAGVCFVVLVAACQPMPTDNTTTNANTAAETKAVAPPSEADMIAKEKASWEAFKRKDADGFKKMLAPEYTEITDSGVRDVAATVARMPDVNLTDVTFADWKMTTVDKDLVLLTYTTKQKGTYKGQAFPEGPYRHAAAWTNRNGEWVAIYYQETMTQTMPPPPPPKEEKKAAESPMAKPGEMGSDVVANEKMVWDALKAKNWDAFAAYLASDSLEIEADGVYDKAGSVKGVQAFDFSKVELSDWKTTKVDDDASLVTYKVKDPGMKPDTSYHTTMWVRRDGKWLALFHMGTPAAASTEPVGPERKM